MVGVGYVMVTHHPSVSSWMYFKHLLYLCTARGTQVPFGMVKHEFPMCWVNFPVYELVHFHSEMLVTLNPFIQSKVLD